MPLGKNDDGTFRVFFEETSLVGLGSRRLSFEECKTRAMQRLAFHKIDVLDVEEEEYCYIPMGGELPDSRQRIIPFGAAAKMVHPVQIIFMVICFVLLNLFLLYFRQQDIMFVVCLQLQRPWQL